MGEIFSKKILAKPNICETPFKEAEFHRLSDEYIKVAKKPLERTQLAREAGLKKNSIWPAQNKQYVLGFFGLIMTFFL